MQVFFQIGVLYVLVGSLRDAQPRYNAPGDLQVENIRNALIDIGLVKLSPQQWPKLGPGAAK